MFAVAVTFYQPAQSPVTESVARIIVIKSDRTLKLIDKNNNALRTYVISLGDPGGKKTRQGDARTPEGVYFIAGRNANSRFHKSLKISYPDAADIKNAATNGTATGGDIMIHGLKNGTGWIGATHRFWNWTDGCIAVTDREIDEIWKLVPNGTPIEIKP